MEANYRIFTIILRALYNRKQLFKIYHIYIHKLNLSLFQALERHNKSNSFQHRLDKGLYLGGTYNSLEAAVYGLAYLHSFPNGRYGGRSQVLCSSRASASIDCRMSYRSHCTLDLDTMDIDHYIHSDRHTHYMLCRLQIEGIAR